MSTSQLIRRVGVLAAALHLLTPAADAFAYGWPVRPFHEQHPVRGFFGDPRIGHTDHGTLRSFHFGIDISAPNGTAVYATTSGEVYLDPSRAETVVVLAGARRYEYWHIAPAVRHGQQAVAYRTVLGHILAPWAHVHLAEFLNGVPLNPLRPGALTPFADRTRPVVHSISRERDGRALGRHASRGSIDLVAEVFDTTPLAVAPPWHGKPVIPAVVRWRLVGRRSSSTWRTAADFRHTIPHASAFSEIFARWTRQNKARKRGRYRIVLARSWDTRTVASGTYRVEVEAVDTRGNRGTGSTILVIRNRR